MTALSERSTEPARRLPAVLRARVGAYVALTKPRIIELLLVTTVPVVSGRRTIGGRPAAKAIPARMVPIYPGGRPARIGIQPTPAGVE